MAADLGQSGHPGDAAVWARQRIPLVAGEEPSGRQRAVLVADWGNGISSQLNWPMSSDGRRLLEPKLISDGSPWWHDGPDPVAEIGRLGMGEDETD